MAASSLALAAVLVAVVLAAPQATASLRSTGLPVPPRGLLRSAHVDKLMSTDDRSARRLLQDATGFQLVAFGENDYGQANPPVNARTNVLQVSGGQYHAVARLADGSIVSWGDDSKGQVSGQPDAATVAAGGGAISIAAGGSHSLVLLINGTVLAWGDDSTGQSTVPDLASKNISTIAAGMNFSLALTQDGNIISWGNTPDAQIPDSIAARTDIIYITARTGVSMALTSTGSILMWGSVLGVVDGLSLDFRAMMPTEAEPAVIVAAGSTHFMAINSNNRVFTWGLLGSNDTTPPPESELYANGRTPMDIAAGYRHSLILMSDGDVIAFGDDQYGQLAVPQPVLNGGANVIGCGFRTSYVTSASLT